jgi:hypothetical protein
MEDVATTPPVIKPEVLHDDLFEGVEVITGESALPAFLSFLNRFGFPASMFPIPGVDEFGLQEKTGIWWIRLKRRYEHEFHNAERLVVYMREVSGKIQQGKIGSLKGWKMKQIKNQELLLPVSAKEMWVDHRTGSVHFKNAKTDVESFPLQAFAPGQ